MLELVYINRFDYLARNRLPSAPLTGAGQPREVGGEERINAAERTSETEKDQRPSHWEKLWRRCRDALTVKRMRA